MGEPRTEELEAERAFLLRSLRDLEAEHAVGDVDDDDYVTLRDGYTARAAAVLRQLDAAAAPSDGPRARRRWGRSAGWVAVVVAVAVLGGWWVARSSGQRLPGDEITGGVGDPNGVTALLAEAREAYTGGDAATAIATYQQVLDADPRNAEALAYSGWLLYLGSTNVSGDLRGDAVEAARDQLEAASAADPAYADPHCFLAVIAANDDAAGAEGDVATAREEGQRCLALDPPADARAIVTRFLDNLPGASTPPTT
jgi:tetratricopeptide (TPR) repeat protein